MSLDCRAVRELLPEYAAGALDGRDRAAIEAHLQTCADCRAEADAFVEVADSVLALAPSAEPPLGFEAAVVNRLAMSSAPLGRRRVWLPLVAAAAALLTMGIGLGRVSAPASDIRTFALSASGDYVGKAWVHNGDPGWIFVDMHYSDPDHALTLEIVDDAGAVRQVGELKLADGHGTLGLRSPVPVSTVTKIRMREPDGTILCQAVLA